MGTSFKPVQSEVSIVFRFDARGIAKRFRQAAVFAALDMLRNSETMRLVNDHDPTPLLDQIIQRHGDRMTIRYIERGPDRFVIDFERT